MPVIWKTARNRRFRRVSLDPQVGAAYQGGCTMSEYFDLGRYTRVVTSIPEAQVWFDRGLVWLFAYNHEEAIVCFEKAVAADPACALAHWGIAYGIGPNYNKAWEIFTPEEKGPALARAHAGLCRGRLGTPAARALHMHVVYLIKMQ